MLSWFLDVSDEFVFYGDNIIHKTYDITLTMKMYVKNRKVLFDDARKFI